MREWFRHYHNADTSKDLGAIMEDFGVKGYGHYWLLIELLYEHFDGKQERFKIPTRRVREKLFMTSTAQVDIFLSYLSKNIDHFDAKTTSHWVTIESNIPKSLLPRAEFKKKDDVDELDELVNELISIWNDTTKGKLPACQAITKRRRQSARKRLKEFPSIAIWEEVILFISKDPFCLGKNDRKWKANIDYLLKPETYVRVVEKIKERNPKLLEIYET